MKYSTVNFNSFDIIVLASTIAGNDAQYRIKFDYKLKKN